MVAFPGGGHIAAIGFADLDVEHGRGAIHLYVVLEILLRPGVSPARCKLRGQLSYFMHN